MTEATVSFGTRRYPVRAGDQLTFGRAVDCTVVLDPDDVALSRRAGLVEYTQGLWWLVNRSTSRPLSVLDDLGLRKVLGPGQRIPVEESVWVVVDGTHSHRLRVDVAAGQPPPVASTAPGAPTLVGETVLVNAADRLAMVALFAEYLEDPPRADPKPKSYRAAAARLGWPRTTLVKRIEYLRARLTNAGVPNLTGFNALANLAEYALSRRLVTKEDLATVRR